MINIMDSYVMADDPWPAKVTATLIKLGFNNPADYDVPADTFCEWEDEYTEIPAEAKASLVAFLEQEGIEYEDHT